MASTVVVGGFFGDEGKGKIISYLALHDKPSIVVRGGAGPNAGHTIKDGDKTYKVRMLPSGFLNKDAKVMVGPGVVVDPDVLLKEITDFDVKGRAFLDNSCGIIEQLKPYLIDVPLEVNSALDRNENVLIEGTQGTHLSLWHGTYPFVTTKDVTASGICADVGVGPKKVDDVIVVFKAYLTRVGTGPMPGELSEEETSQLGWEEFGTVTGRLRRAAEFDFELAKRAVMLSSANQISITKLDVRFPNCAGITSYNELEEDAKSFIKNIEEELGVKVTLIGTGPSINDVIDLRT